MIVSVKASRIGELLLSDENYDPQNGRLGQLRLHEYLGSGLGYRLIAVMVPFLRVNVLDNTILDACHPVLHHLHSGSLLLFLPFLSFAIDLFELTIVIIIPFVILSRSRSRHLLPATAGL